MCGFALQLLQPILQLVDVRKAREVREVKGDALILARVAIDLDQQGDGLSSSDAHVGGGRGVQYVDD